MTRVIVHAGFHKTGTTSLQSFLEQNRAALTPYFVYYGKADFLQAGANARIYGQRPYTLRRLLFRRAFRRFLNTLPDAPLIVLSRETFSGVMPGHKDIMGRTITDQTTVAIRLARDIRRALLHRFGPGTQVDFLYTVRDTESWLRSVYGHLLRSIHLTQDYDDFRAALADTPGPQATAERIARALDPTPVHIARLADFADHPHGPAAAVLALAGVPADVQLSPAAHKNPGQTPQQEDAFLRLNRQHRDKARLKAMKDDILNNTGNQHRV